MSHNMVKLDKCFDIMAPFYIENVNYKFPAGSREHKCLAKILKMNLNQKCSALSQLAWILRLIYCQFLKEVAVQQSMHEEL